MAKKTVICSNCGAEFDAHLEKCPYCDALNPGGAEAKYMRDLWGVHRNLDQLHHAGIDETKAAGKQVQRMIRKTLVFAGILLAVILIGSFYFVRIHTGEPEDNYTWKVEHFPLMDEAYESQDYDTLLELYEDALEKGAYGVMDWEHHSFVSTLLEIREGNYILDEEDLSNSRIKPSLLTLELSVELFDQIAPNETETAKAAIQQLGQRLIADRQERFPIDEQQLSSFITGGVGYYYVDFEKCEQYLKQ